MKKRLLFAAMLLLPVAAQCSSGQAHSISVEIKAPQTARNSEELSVSTSIRNSGEATARILVWACAFPSEWAVDNPNVDLHQPNCLSEGKTWITLKRGEVYKRVLSVSIHLGDVPAGQSEVTFRMGFGNRIFPEGQKHNTKAEATWSNPVTILVKK